MKRLIQITLLFGLLAVVIGAFGAHGLKGKLTVEALESLETAVRYQFYHVFAILFVISYNGFSSSAKKKIGLLMLCGIACFSGSIYLLHLTPLTASQLWFVTPFGGLLLIGGWASMLFAVQDLYSIQKGKKKQD